MEEELTEARGWAEEERGREKDCREGRDHLQADLKSTEKILEDAYAELEKEKAQRYMYVHAQYSSRVHNYQVCVCTKW